MPTLDRPVRPPYASAEPGVTVARPVAPYAVEASKKADPADRYLAFLGVALLGYALFGRGFAYVGVAPLFVGEALLVAGMFVAWRAKALWLPLRTATGVLMALFVAWGLVRTLPFVGTYGVDALRDAVLWGYAGFAFVVAGLVLRHGARLRTLVLRYRRFGGVFVGLIWLVFIVFTLFWSHIPTWPGSEVHLIEAKGGDVLVHLAGVAVLLLSGFVRISLPMMLGLALSLATVITSNRGGMVAFGAAVLIALAMRPREPRLARPVLITVAFLAALVLINPRIEVPGQYRPISLDQVTENVQSLFQSSDAGGLNRTVSWRFEWWEKILDYTFTGPYFWGGKGFGVNLAVSDGIAAPDVLRSPHNGHLTVLARMGVPGFALWLAMLGAWYAAALSGWWRARLEGDRAWMAVWTVLVPYLTAFLINASFDVYLEGPMGGIWFWTVFGTGLAAAVAQRRAPSLLHDPPSR